MEKLAMNLVEKQIENYLAELIDLKIEEDYAAMGQQIAKLLAFLQQQQLISSSLEVIVDPSHCLPETALLLMSLQEAQNRHRSRRHLLTHRQILNIWLRKNEHYKREILPGFF